MRDANAAIAATVPVAHHATGEATADAGLRHWLATAEERLTELKALVEDLRRDRDAWRDQAQGRSPIKESSLRTSCRRPLSVRLRNCPSLHHRSGRSNHGCEHQEHSAYTLPEGQPTTHFHQ